MDSTTRRRTIFLPAASSPALVGFIDCSVIADDTEVVHGSSVHSVAGKRRLSPSPSGDRPALETHARKDLPRPTQNEDGGKTTALPRITELFGSSGAGGVTHLAPKGGPPLWGEGRVRAPSEITCRYL